MDLSMIKKNIESGALRTTAEFQRDMMLMFTNAIMYNNSDHDVYNMAVEMYNDVMVHIEVSRLQKGTYTNESIPLFIIVRTNNNYNTYHIYIQVLSLSNIASHNTL